MICRRVTALRRLSWLAVFVAVGGGCTRAFFRERADQDVDALLAEKSIDPRWAVEGWYVYPDARARFADADKPDHPKKPPDDPGAAALAPDPQPLRSKYCSGPDQEGYGYLEFLQHCDQYNRTARADKQPAATLGDPTRVYGAETVRAVAGLPPEASADLPSQKSIDAALRTDERPFLLTLDQAAELSLFNSRDFQDRREDLYLAALPVTLERYAFITQFTLGASAVRTWLASDRPGGPGSRWDIATTGRVTQLVPTGATLVAQLANQLTINLGTGTPTIGISNLTLSLLQPLLRGGGTAVTLEPLTQAERTLVYGVRSYARFRKNYYVYIAGGGELTNAPFGLTALAAIGVGPSIPAPSQGYLPTLLTAAQERNERENLRALTAYLALYREFQGRGDFSELQVGQVEQQILTSQQALLQRRQDLQNGLDQFKLQLGVPTRLPLDLDDEPMTPVRDMLREFTRAQDQYLSLRSETDLFRAQFQVPLQALAGSMIAPIPIDVPLRAKLEQLMFNSPMTRETKRFRKVIPGRWDRWRQLTTEQIRAEVRRLAEEVRELELRQARLEIRGEKLPADEQARLDALGPEIALAQFELSLRAFEAGRQKKGLTAREAAALYEDAVNDFMRVMNEARVERRRLLRESWPKLPPVCVDSADILREDLDRAQTVAAQAALSDRLDLMNSRGLTVDAWRRITVAANSLLGVLNVGYNFDTPSTPNANEPFALGGSRSRHQLVINGELPLVRRAERNQYRTALIAYQRARRNLQATEDFVLNDVRTDLRALRVLAENFRIQQRAVEVAYDQVENSLDVLQAPPQPEAGGAAAPGRAAAQGQQQAANAASLTQQLLSAQNSLLRAQNGLYTVWVQYLIARMTFYRDIERLPLDPRGVWIDEPCSPTAVEPETLPTPGPRQDPAAGRFADLRAAGDR
ncbi:MAG TPA: TolC family protein [Gemmataceae bacterium]|nr:TolC family protein [Gemmataceae bacterium]